MTHTVPDKSASRQLPAGRYGFDALEVGDTFSTARRAVDGELIDRFAALTGDFFEIHMTIEGAQKHGFSGRVAHGLVVLSLVDGLKNQSPQQFDAIASLGWDWKFERAVLLGDEIAARLTLTGKRLTRDERRGILQIAVHVTNQRGEAVQSGVNLLMVHR